MSRGLAAYALIAILLIPLMTESFSLEENNVAEITNPRLVNSFGTPVVDLLNVNQQVQITADIKNLESSNQKFTYIVQIKNEDDIVVSLAWISGALTSKQVLSPAISWTPRSQGTYTIEIFVWESFANQYALAKQATFTATVS